jgi:protoheme IX farnesyltransferase
MRRTRARPIPAGRVDPSSALGFGLVLAAFSVAVLGLAANWLAASLLATTIIFYAIVYTMWLKRWTAQNIVIGGAAGALPPVIGWAAVAGGVSLEPLLYFLIVFLWTPPHFWALAIFTRSDYERAGIPMMPNVAGEESTRRQILAYAVLLAPVGALPWLLGFAGPLYGAAAALLGAEFVRRALLLLRRGDAEGNRAAKRLFGYSIVYLFALFAVRLVDALLAGLIGG